MRPTRFRVLAAAAGLGATMLQPLPARGQNVRVEAGPVAEGAPSTEAPSRAQEPLPPRGREPDRAESFAGSPGIRADDPAATASVRGVFGPEEGESLSFVDGFAWRETSAQAAGDVIRVHLADHPLDHAELDRAVDLSLELDLQCEGCAFAELELDARDAAWLATRYRLPDGSACGGCETSPARRRAARLRFDGRRLRGGVEAAASDAAGEPGLELTLDLPVATPSGVGELPADGGEPARALEICRAAVRSGHAEGIRSFCFTSDRVPPAGEAVAAAVEGLDALAASTLRIDGGRVRGDRALLRVETVGAEGRQRGVVLMVRTPAGWRHRAEKLHPAWED